MWQIILWSIGAFYALLIVPLLAYALCWFIREIPAFLKQRSTASSAAASKPHTFAGNGTNNLSPSNQQANNGSLNQSPRPHAVNTPKRIHIQSITTPSVSSSPIGSPSIPAPPLSPSVSTPNERIIRVQPSQSNLHGSIHPLDNSSPFPSFSKLPFLESSDSSTSSASHSAQNSAPPSPPSSMQPMASIDMMLGGNDSSDDSDDHEIRALEDYFTRSSAAAMSLDSVLAMSKPGFNRVASSELHSRVVIPVHDSAPPTPDTTSMRQNPYSKEFEGGALPMAVVTSSNVALSPKSLSMYSSAPSHISQAALLIAKRATTSQFKSTAPFPFSPSAHVVDTPSNFSVRAVA